MPRTFWAFGLLLLAGAAVGGCADNPLVLKGQVESLQQQQLALSRQNKELQDKVAAADRDNQETSSLLARAKQQNQISEDSLREVQRQLEGATTQLAEARQQKRATEEKVQTLTASLHRQGGVTITPNNSLLQTLPAINIPQVLVRRDGDVIRIELPGSQLFDSGGARLRASSPKLITDVAAEIARTYPDQMIGVEGHTDSDPVAAGPWHNHHELSVAWALAVYDVLTGEARIPGNQLFLVGHGANHPVVSNATPAGKERNRRVELVIYPDKAPRQ